MTTAANKPDWISRVLSFLLLPAVWLERAQGRKRLGLLLLYGVIAVFLGACFWWANQLRGLPNIGDPFDLAAFSAVTIPDEDNAFTLYRPAAAMLGEITIEESQSLHATTDWTQADPIARAYLETHRATLNLWRLGTERPDAMVVPPGEMTIEAPLGPVFDLHRLARLAALEGSRLETEGDMVGAWQWYRAIVRCGWHAGRYGGLIQRQNTAGITTIATEPILRWARDPRTDLSLIHRSLEDVAALRRALPPDSETLKIEYIILKHMIDDPNMPREFHRYINQTAELWYLHNPLSSSTYFFARREPERSRRLARLCFANWLEYIDVSPYSQPPLESNGTLGLFVPTADAPPSLRALPPKEIERWIETTWFARSFMHGQMLSWLGRDRDQFDMLLLQLADSLHEREHGQAAGSIEDLYQIYLDPLVPEYAELELE